MQAFNDTFRYLCRLTVETYGINYTVKAREIEIDTTFLDNLYNIIYAEKKAYIDLKRKFSCKIQDEN